MSEPPVSMTRAYASLLIGVLLLHAFIVGAAVMGALSAKARDDYDAWEFVAVIAIAFPLLWAMLERWPRYMRAVGVLTMAVVAAALVTPFALALGAFMFLNAYIVGDRLLRWSKASSTSNIKVSFSVVALIGWSAWLGVMALATSLRVHFPPVYAAALFIPLIVEWRRVSAALNAARQWLTQVGNPPRRTERTWVALMLTVAVVHLFVVAKPDVGYDANAVHMQFAAIFADQHRWAYDVTRYAWAVMPLGADLAFATAYILGGGEQAARLLNLGFGIIALQIAFDLVRRYASREVALASVCLLASTPLAFLETGSLFVENLWTAFLLGALLLAVEYAQSRGALVLIAIALVSAGAMQTKVIGAVWLAPVLLVVAVLGWKHGLRRLDRRHAALIVFALVIAVFPYVNAWVRTGNPLFPFLNNIFRSPYFAAAASFSNPMYETSLHGGSIYELFLSSGRFIEGADGAAGFHWLLLLPVIVLVLVRSRIVAQWLCVALAAIFFVVVFSQQAYLRYLVPFLLLLTVLGGWALGSVVRTRATRLALLLVGGCFVLLHIPLMHTASWPNVTLCTGCALGQSARRQYVAMYLPDRIIATYLDDTLRTERVAFFVLNAPGACGYIGYSRAANWHDFATYQALLAAESADDVLAIVRRSGLTHAVLLDATQDPDSVLAKFRDRYTVPIWAFAGRVVALIKPGPD